MAIKIELINCAQDPTIWKPEESAAAEIKEQFQKEFSKYPNAKGTLYILRSLSIFGYPVRDLDLVLIGSFQNFQYKGKFNTINYDEINDLYIDSFICNIELKDITPRNRDKLVIQTGVGYIYTYENSGEKRITEQAFNQMNSFRDFLKDRIGIKPFMADVIWFRALKRDQLNEKRKGVRDNALASDFTFRELLNVLLLRMNVNKNKQTGTFHLNTFEYEDHKVKQITDILLEKRELKGLTKKKFELLSQGSINIENLKKGVGEQITIFEGRAGTGKTIKLLQLAFFLANTDNKKRCLLLTYNNALVCDIRRLIDFTNIPVAVNGRTVNIQTVDSFFIQLLIQFGIIKPKGLIPTARDYRQKFNQALNGLYESLLKDINDKDDAKALKDLAKLDSNMPQIDWDYILIDEGQDWPDLFKKVLFKLYGPERIIVADGVDQFMMTPFKQNWSEGLDVNLPPKMKLGLRQKNNLIEFVNSFSYELRLGWELERNNQLPGGDIDIYDNYNSTIHKNIHDLCKENGCEDYDILILVPPSSVDTEKECFKYYQEYKDANIKIFDGTNSANRHRYPTKDMARVYQYDSCRGLEGWVTVCFEFDELIKTKLDNTSDEVIKQFYTGFDLEEGRKKYVYTWALMPLTRPIDKLVITLDNPNSEIGCILKNLSTYFDFVHWNIND